MQKKSIDDLNQLYSQSEQADQEVFAEQRSNIMLIAGDQYTKKSSKFTARIRDNRDLSLEQKLRLTKNHLSKIAKSYLNSIVSAAPGVAIVPRNEREIQDQKAAQLNASVWAFAKDTQNLDEKVISLAKDYVDCGEAFIKCFFDPMKGRFLGYEQALDPMGEPVVDETGQPAPDESRPRFEGQLVFEQIHPFNVLRDPSSQSMDESYLIVRKMVPIADLKKMVGDDQEKLKAIQPSNKDEFMVFDAARAGYQQTKDMALVMEFYFRPGPQYPLGYFYIATKSGVLFEGELPFGIFPIEYVGFDPIQTTPRHRSIVKQLRPYQLEINRTASKIAETQVTSDDKILIQSGTKISSGGVLPGIRAIQYAGAPPTVLEGRTGEQYLNYLQSQITEMYQVANLAEELEDKQTQADPYAMLFRSVRDKKKFTIYVSKFENFLRKVCLLYLSLAKHYLTDEMLIPAIGKNEYVNMQEFRSTQPLQFQVEVKPMSDDINTLFGKALSINHAIQYLGPNMEKDQVGHLLRQMPFANFDESFSDFTLDYDTATNMILALERGEQVEPAQSDNKQYMLKRLDKRMRMSDFRLLDPQIQNMFFQVKQAYEQMIVAEMKAMQAAQQGFIPTGGALIKTDLQVMVPNTTGGVKTTRAAFPVEALEWLDKKLKDQGIAQERMQSELSQAEIAQVSQEFNQAPPSAPMIEGPMQAAPNPDDSFMAALNS